MKFFTKEEIKKVGLILGVLLAVSFFNFRGSLTKARNAQRNSDLTYIREKLEEYQSEVGHFPAAGRDGTILACKSEITVVNLEFKRLENPAPCRWGEDSLVNFFSDTPKTIVERLPVDPQNDDGVRYIYKSSLSRFQIYASLEGKGEAEYNEKVAALKIKCGTRICNFGKAFSDTPLDKT
ncbi:hypothetical protein HY502_01035, partial [Candidatus Woesebacteria bacterium]|nr:hypothetical protein [Candidatus Woesebacteria bacterium]